MGAFQGSLNGRTVTYGGITTNIPATPLSELSRYEVTLTPTATQEVRIANIRSGSRSIGSSGGPANVAHSHQHRQLCRKCLYAGYKYSRRLGRCYFNFGTELIGTVGRTCNNKNICQRCGRNYFIKQPAHR